ncbi:AI-2E family transporter [Natrarchaeobius oligotrophus]|uniref:AI-2E family transporter n=1 Tax=Natrarchaeobius chitinivorans TaxID=1679083 RepID=A0A3N6M3R8_NATCH|nr:AI-2E family transporter [Natrarchaeobius chitinivorans]RQG98128.1 AI-2E family transporter [Natrarchaeobius chitinivorans]
MVERLDPSEWFSERPGLLAIAVASTAFGLVVILPYLQYILLGVVLAYILMPAQRRLETYVRSMTAALVLVVVAILAILLPLAYVLAIAIREALEIATAVQEGNLSVDAIESRLEATGYAVDLGELYQTYEEPIATGVQGLATRTMDVVTGLPGILIGLTVTLFVLFALLRDGDALVAWFGRVLPIDDEIQRELRRELDQLMWASVVGNVAVAGIQAVLLGVGLALLDVPVVIFLTVATFVLALLPLVGAFGVWVPVTLYLLALDRPVAAATLAVYGSLVSASDTYLRPALIGRTSAFNSAIVVVGIFGGLVVFGAVGLFIGPVVLGGAKIALDVYAREREGATAARTLEDEETAADPAAETDDETGIASETDENGRPAVESDEVDAAGRDDADWIATERADPDSGGASERRDGVSNDGDRTVEDEDAAGTGGDPDP